MHRRLRRRLVAHGPGFHPFGEPTPADLTTLAVALAHAGRSLDELELIEGTRAEFPTPDQAADLDAAMAPIAAQYDSGYTTFRMKPFQFTDNLAEVPDLVGHFMTHLEWLAD